MREWSGGQQSSTRGGEQTGSDKLIKKLPSTKPPVSRPVLTLHRAWATTWAGGTREREARREGASQWESAGRFLSSRPLIVRSCHAGLTSATPLLLLLRLYGEPLHGEEKHKQWVGFLLPSLLLPPLLDTTYTSGTPPLLSLLPSQPCITC